MIDIKLIGSTNNMTSLEEMLRFSQDCARVCYYEGDYEELRKEKSKEKLVQRLIKLGHHSIFEHVNLTFYMNGLPKMLAMVLNNEKQYATSEKSARYTQMSEIDEFQKEKYGKWMNILIPEIDKVFPNLKDKSERKKSIKKLAQENARYMTSVFTPTKMVHTINLRQLNFLQYEFDDFIKKYEYSDEILKSRLTSSMKEFLRQTNFLKIDGLKNQTDRHLSLFNDKKVKEHFGDVYSTNYLLSFAGVAQAQRHRTINYHISDGIQQGAKFGFFIPDVLSEELKSEWVKDLKEIAEYDIPQAQLIRVNERGIKEDFKSKRILRECGHAQYEIMKNTLGTSWKYFLVDDEIIFDGKPKCTPNGCKGCPWGNRYGTKRKV